MSTVSVIMPVYNTEEFLDESISSVLNQTYKDIELILINDYSSDRSEQVIDHYKKSDVRIKVIHFNEHRGVGAARNEGINAATGKYIYFMDSDDYLGSDTLRLLVKNIKDYPLISGKQQKAHVSKDYSHNDTNVEEQKIEIYKENKFELINNGSALNRLFRKSYIIEKNLIFAEQVDRYTDLAFIVPAILHVDSIPYIDTALYYKRKRNDPITNPALMQTGMKDRINDFNYIYHRLKDEYSEHTFVNKFLDNRFLIMYRKSIVHYFRIGENINDVFADLVSIVKRVDSKLIKDQPYFTRKEIKVLKRGDISLYKKVNLRHHRYRKIKEAIKGKTRLYVQLYRAVFLKLPIKNKTVVFESFLGKSYSDSPKYIYEYMLKNDYDYKYIWIVNNRKQIPGNPKQVKRFSILYFYYLARAKYWVSNSRMPRTLNKRDGNIYLQTWHGTPLKKLVFDMKDVHSADPAYKRNFYNQSRRWDYLSSPNAYSSEIFRRAFKYEKELLEFGYPRNDILYEHNNEEDIDQLKKKMGLPADKKVILYAPTWRDDEFYERGKYKFSLQLDLNKLKEQLGDEYIVLLRMHYFIASKLDISDHKGFAYDFSSYDDIAELYLISDILITDYSSVFFDYANLKRPILFYTYDLEKYRDTLRGFYIDIENEAPGPLLKTNNEVLNAILNIENVKKEYKENYKHFYNRFCSWDDGNASKKTVERVFGDS